MPETFDRWFLLVADLVKPSFPADELTVARRSFAAELAARRSTSTAATSDLFIVVSGTSSRPIVATAQMLSQVSGERIGAWHRERYTPQNTVLSIAGAIDAQQAEKTVRASLAGWPRTSFTETPPAVQMPPQRTVHVMERPGSVQATLMLGGPTTNRADADHLPLLLANTVLGAGPGSRLFRRLREELAISYNAQSAINTYRHGGYWLVYGDTSVARAGDAVTAFLDELKRLSTRPIPQSDMDDAKRALVGRFALTLEVQSQQAAYMGQRRTEGLSADYWSRYPDMLRAVTADDVRRAAAKYIDPGRVQIVAVGDRAQLAPVLTRFGPITFYDADGRPLQGR